MTQKLPYGDLRGQSWPLIIKITLFLAPENIWKNVSFIILTLLYFLVNYNQNIFFFNPWAENLPEQRQEKLAVVLASYNFSKITYGSWYLEGGRKCKAGSWTNCYVQALHRIVSALLSNTNLVQRRSAGPAVSCCTGGGAYFPHIQTSQERHAQYGSDSRTLPNGIFLLMNNIF